MRTTNNRVLQALLGFAGACVLSGCMDLASPQKVVEGVAFAIERNQFSNFKYALRDEALKEFGNRAAFAELQKTFKSYQQLAIDEPTFLDQEFVDGYTYNVYLVPVFGRLTNNDPEVLVFDTRVRCVYRESQSSQTSLVSTNPGPVASPGTQASSESCRISEINLQR